MKRLGLILLSVCAIAAAAISCAKEEAQEIKVTSVTLNQTSLELVEGGISQLVATVTPSDAVDKKLTWKSSDESVATVANDGVVTAVKAGSATITATAGSKSAQCSVTVTAKYVAVISVSINKRRVGLEVDESETLTASILPETATDKTLTWSTSDEKIATVDKDGKVTAVALGEAVITVKAGDKTDECKITVNPTEVTSVELDKEEITLRVKGEETLTATVKPDKATDKTVTWSSSSEKIATVDKDGKVTAVALGTATITAKAGKQTAECKVTVEPTPVESVELSETSVTIMVKGTATLTATVKPDDATDKTVTWSSSDEKIATVDKGVITGVGIGKATITATSGEKSATCEVIVDGIPVESISLNKKSCEMEKGTSITLKATVLPEDASDKTVTWTSSNQEVASVNGVGKVSATKTGSATITASAGGHSARCEITVINTNVESVSLDCTYWETTPGESKTLHYTVYPSDVTYSTVTWATTEAQTAAVSDGVVTIGDIGPATITVTIGGKSATCEVVSHIAAPEMVDLGLTVKWAKWNVFASSPEQLGHKYAWAEYLRKDAFGQDNYKYAQSAGVGTWRTTKYNYNGPSILEAEDDVCTVAYGSTYRMPTYAEAEELMNSDNCTWTWTTVSGVSGFLVTSKKAGYTDKSIFLPAGGYTTSVYPYVSSEGGEYWTSVAHSMWQYWGAGRMAFTTSGPIYDPYSYERIGWRDNGHYVRAVCTK